MQRGETINILLPGPCNIRIPAARASLTRGSIASIRSVRHRQHLFDLQSTRNNSIHIENAQNRDLSFSITTRNNDNEQLLSEVFYDSGLNVLVINNKWRYTRWTVDALMDPWNDGYLHPMSKSDLLNIELLPHAFEQFGRNRIDISIGNGGHIGLFFSNRKLIQVRFNPRYYVARTLDNIDRLYTNWLFKNRELIAELANPNAQNVAQIQDPIELGADVVIANRNRIEGVVELANLNAQNVAPIQDPIESSADAVTVNRNQIVARNYSLEHFLQNEEEHLNAQENAEKLPIESDAEHKEDDKDNALAMTTDDNASEPKLVIDDADSESSGKTFYDDLFA